MAHIPPHLRTSSEDHGIPGDPAVAANIAALEQKIRNRSARVAVIGQGYVGFPLAQATAGAGFTTIGYDTNEATVEEVRRHNRSHRYMATSSPTHLEHCDIALVAVPTPTTIVDGERRPDLSMVLAATRNLLAHWPERGAPRMLVLESTYGPGTTRNEIAPLVNTWHEVGRSVFLAYSPERIDPGNQRYGLTNTPKIVSGYDEGTAFLAALFYSHFVDSVVEASTLEAAEATKILENTFRFLNIAFMQEFDEFCEAAGLDAGEIARLAATKPFGFMPFFPGAGIGGHCIAEDPYYLEAAAERFGAQSEILKAALRNHEARAGVIVRRIEGALGGRGLPQARVLLLGVSYKPDVPDTRESPALALLEQLEAAGATVSYHDALVGTFADRRSIDLEAASPHDYDLTVLVTAHSTLRVDELQSRGWRIFDTNETPARSDAVFGPDVVDDLIRHAEILTNPR